MSGGVGGPLWPVTDQYHHGSGHMGTPPVNRQTDKIENIIFPQTTCVGGKNNLQLPPRLFDQ